MNVMNVPVPFSGTTDQADVNFSTHDFRTWGYEDDMDSRCARCDCKPWHKAAAYPCGQEPPRMLVIRDGDTEWVIRENEETPTDLPTEVAEIFTTHIKNWGW